MRAPAPLLTWLRNTIGVFPIRSVTLAAILDPGAAVDLAGGASVAAAFTCASALHINAVRLLCAAACVRCLRGLATNEFLNVLPCMHTSESTSSAFWLTQVYICLLVTGQFGQPVQGA